MSKFSQNFEKYEMDLTDISIDNLANLIIKRNPLYFDDLKKWWGFNKDLLKWVQVDEVDIISYIKKSYKISTLSSSKHRTSMLNALKDEARLNKPKKANQYCIQIGKWIYDISNKKKILASENIICKLIIDRDIENITDEDKCDKIDELFTDWVGDEKDNLYEIISFIISPIYFIDVCFWLVGQGDNGKGLYQTIINTLIGIRNTTSQDVELLCDPKDRFTKLFLKDKLLCSLGDGNHQPIRNSKGIKTLAGNTDVIRGEIKGGGQIDFRNTAKLVGAYNTLPICYDKTKGWYRRQYIQEFKNSFSGMKNPVKEIDEKEYDVLLYKCFKKLTTLFENNKLEGWGNYEDRKNKYNKLSNPIKLFINENCVESEEFVFFGKTMHKEYMKFAVKSGFNSFRYDEFETRLLNEGYYRKRKDVYHINGLCWGKISEVPEEFKDNIKKNKFFVFFGLKSKIDTIDRKDTFFKSEIHENTTNSKRVSIVSIVSKNRQKEQELYDYLEVNCENNAFFVNSTYDYRLIDMLKEMGKIEENPSGTYRKV